MLEILIGLLLSLCVQEAPPIGDDAVLCARHSLVLGPSLTVDYHTAFLPDPSGAAPERLRGLVVHLSDPGTSLPAVELDLVSSWVPAARGGWLIVAPFLDPGWTEDRRSEALSRFVEHFSSNRRFPLENRAAHLAALGGNTDLALEFALREPHRIASLFLIGSPPAAPESLGRARQLRFAPVHLLPAEPGPAEEELARKLEASGVRVTRTRIPPPNPTEMLAETGPGTGEFDRYDVVEYALDPEELARSVAVAQQSRSLGAPEVEVARTLHRFHRAAATADENIYFGSFAPEGVFLGTDSSERWTVEEFRRWAARFFERESAWVFHPLKQFITTSDGDFAVFDEVLHSEHLGECRGSGALRRIDGEWRIVQYNLAFPVPNDLAGALVADIRAHQNGDRSRVSQIILAAPGEITLDAVEDPPLTPRGRSQARDLARFLARARLDGIWCDSSRAARETVQPLEEGDAPEPGLFVSPEEIPAEEGGTRLIVGSPRTLTALLERWSVEAEAPLAGDGGVIVVTRALGSAPSAVRLSYTAK